MILRAEPGAPLRVLVLVSGAGTLLQALLDAQRAGGEAFDIVAVGADRDGIAGLLRAQEFGVPTFVVRPAAFAAREDWDQALAAELTAYAPDVVVSAGFMRILGPAVLRTVPVLNTHPALLPSFPGAHAVRDALAHGVRITGATCHWVDAGVDTGPIIAQRAVPIEPDDTESVLHERIKAQERVMLLDVLRELASDQVR